MRTKFGLLLAMAIISLAVIGFYSTSKVVFAGDDGDWAFSGNNIYRTSGNVGIGTASPDAPLQIGSSGNSIRLGYWNSDNSDIDGLLPGSQFGSLIQGGDNAHVVVGLKENDPFDAFSIISGGGNYMTNETYDSVVLYVKATGNVGIGTTSPDAKLNVNGDIHLGTSNPKPSDYWAPRAFLTDIAGYIGTQGSWGLSMAWNGYRSNAGTNVYWRKFNGVGINDFDTVSNIEMRPGGIFFSSDNINDATTEFLPTTRMYIGDNGNIGIGITNPGEKLSVNGTIKAKEVIIETTGWPDFVFSKNYDLMPLSQLEKYIDNNKHLPEIPSVDDVSEKGVKVGDIQAKLLQKIEELTLYMIDLEKKTDVFKSESEILRGESEMLKKENELVKKRLAALEMGKM